MNPESQIDGKQATKLAIQYFVEQYGDYGVNIVEVESAEYNENDKSWTITCSFYRSMLAQQRLYYSVVVYSDGRIGPVRKIGEPSQ